MAEREQDCRSGRHWLRQVAWPVLAVALPAQAGELAFAYADAAGKRLLAPVELAAPARIRQALCPGNELVAVRFLGTQAADPRRDSGRAAAANFAHQAGQLFALVANEVAANDTCLLAPPEFFRVRGLLAYEARLAREDQREECSEVLQGRIAAARQRALAGCWPLATIGGQDGVYAVLFEARANERLAALVLDRGARLAFEDYPGDARHLSSVWRVDDGGEFEPGAFDILFIVEGPAGVELGVEWVGVEGASVRLLQVDGARFRARLAGYFYRAP